MDVQQKMAAIKSIAPNSVITWLSRDKWHCSVPSVEVHTRSTLRSCGGWGPSVEEAINNCWKHMTVIQDDEYLVARAMTPQRRAFRWNEFMWQEVEEVKAGA